MKASTKAPISACILICLSGASVRAQDPGAAPAPQPPMLLHLRDGRAEWGSIQSHEPEGLVFARLDNGGIVRFPWTQLDPAQEQALKIQYGYVDLTGDEVLIDADRIVTTDGTELIGRILDRTADSILLKTAGSIVPIRKDRIGGAATTVQVRALEVFSQQELYDQQVLAHPPADAAGHFALGQYCERILDFAHALEQYKLATEADAGFRTADLRLAIARATEKAKNQDQLEYLADVDSELARKHYDKALAKADAFKEKFPASSLIPDAKKRHDRIVKARDRDLTERVARLWIGEAGMLTHKAALEKTFEEALAYLEEPMKQELLDLVVKDVQKISKEVTPDVVRQMWASRKKIIFHHASYGLGTWLLGKDAALKGMETDKDKKEQEKKPATEVDKQRADLQKKIAAFLQNQEMARKAQSKEEKSGDREGFWKEYPSMSRSQWLLAYFVENSGLFEIAKPPNLSNCPDCGGVGTREIAVVGSNVATSMIGKGQIATNAECPICHGIGRIRRISYR